MDNVLEQDGAEAPETPTEEHHDDQPSVDPEIEQRARDMGWAPRDRWKGPPEAFVEADEFVRRGEEFIPFLKADRRKLEEQLHETRGQLDERDAQWQERFDRLERMNQMAMERQANQIRSEFSERKRQAVEMGDTEQYDRLDAQEREQVRELEEQTREAAPKEPEAKPQPDQAAAQRTLDNWKADNPWFTQDPVLKRQAVGIMDEIEAEMPNADLTKKLEEVANRVREDMPERFNGGGRPRANAVEGGSRTTGSARSAKQANKLPAEAKQAGQKYVEQGLFKDIEEYATEYFKYE
jgi:hypothetical protein